MTLIPVIGETAIDRKSGLPVRLRNPRKAKSVGNICDKTQKHGGRSEYSLLSSFLFADRGPLFSFGRLPARTALGTRYRLQTTEPNVPICIICSVLPYTVTRTHTHARMSILTRSCTHIDHLSLLRKEHAGISAACN